MCPPAPSGHVQPLEVTGVGFQPLIDDRLNRSWQESQSGVCALEKGFTAPASLPEMLLSAGVLHLDITSVFMIHEETKCLRSHLKNVPFIPITFHFN